MVSIYEEIRRVLKPEGTCWLNIGDSYANDTKWGGHSGEKNYTSAAGGYAGQRQKRYTGLKPKDLCLIPFRLAIALQEAGWWVRSDIIWSKPNPMPESVTDRPTRAHEYLFLLAKSERYCFDAEAVREPNTPDMVARALAGHTRGGTVNGRDASRMDRERLTAQRNIEANGRNIRSVWTVPTQPFPEAHFAVYPEKLIEPCIKAGCPKDGIVLDPFTGAGTTALVARRLGCRFIGSELNPEYCEIAAKRLSQGVLQFK